jgi:hypothetical protein
VQEQKERAQDKKAIQEIAKTQKHVCSSSSQAASKPKSAHNAPSQCDKSRAKTSATAAQGRLEGAKTRSRTIKNHKCCELDSPGLPAMFLVSAFGVRFIVVACWRRIGFLLRFFSKNTIPSIWVRFLTFLLLTLVQYCRSLSNGCINI